MVKLKRKVSLKAKQSIEAPQPKKRIPSFVWASIIVLFVIAGVIFIITNDRSGDNNDNLAATTPAAIEEDGTKSPGVSSEDTNSTSDAVAPASDEESQSEDSDQGVAHEPGQEKSEELTSSEKQSDISADASESETEQQDVETTDTEPGNIPYQANKKYVVFEFGFNTWDVFSDPELTQLVKVLKEFPEMKIQITAYTDNVGSAEFNQVLSEKRARAIFDFLVSEGIDNKRLKYQGMGISSKFDNATDEGRNKNRRAEFELTM